MPNPLNYFSQKDIEFLGLTPDDIAHSYQPSSGSVYHIRGDEGVGKTLFAAHFIRNLIDNLGFDPSDGFGNISLKGKYGNGYTLLRGENLYQFLWDLLRVPLKHKFVLIDEIDLEFPARFYPSKDQTEIALGMWQMKKLGNYVLYTSHVGNSTDLIFHLASHFIVLPEIPDFETQSLDFTLIDKLHRETSYWTANDVIRTMLIYNRQESTTAFRERKQSKKKEKENQGQKIVDSFDLDFSESNNDILPAY